MSLTSVKEFFQKIVGFSVKPTINFNVLIDPVTGEPYSATGGGGGGGSIDTSVLSKEGKQDDEIAKLVEIRNKIIADPSTQGKQDAANIILNNILAELRDDVFVQATIWEDRSNTTSVFFREE